MCKESYIHFGTIPLYLFSNVGEFHNVKRNFLENSYIHVGKCWKIPLWTLESVGNVRCPCRNTHVGKFHQPCCLVLWHPTYMLEFASVLVTVYKIKWTDFWGKIEPTNLQNGTSSLIDVAAENVCTMQKNRGLYIMYLRGDISILVPAVFRKLWLYLPRRLYKCRPTPHYLQHFSKY
jgi:hypothetical protein